MINDIFCYWPARGRSNHQGRTGLESGEKEREIREKGEGKEKIRGKLGGKERERRGKGKVRERR